LPCPENSGYWLTNQGKVALDQAVEEEGKPLPNVEVFRGNKT